jgi:hypothetical protein
MKLSNSITRRNQFFAGTLFAMSLFGFHYSHHAKVANGRHHVNLIMQGGDRQSDDDSQYAPPQSPGTHREFGS